MNCPHSPFLIFTISSSIADIVGFNDIESGGIPSDISSINWNGDISTSLRCKILFHCWVIWLWWLAVVWTHVFFPLFFQMKTMTSLLIKILGEEFRNYQRKINNSENFQPKQEWKWQLMSFRLTKNNRVREKTPKSILTSIFQCSPMIYYHTTKKVEMPTLEMGSIW